MLDGKSLRKAVFLTFLRDFSGVWFLCVGFFNSTKKASLHGIAVALPEAMLVK